MADLLDSQPGYTNLLEQQPVATNLLDKRAALLDRTAQGQQLSPEEQAKYDMETATVLDEARKGLRRFGFSAMASTQAFVGALTAPVMPNVGNDLIKAGLRTMDEMPRELKPAVENWDDIHDARTGALKLASAFGEGAPSAALTVAGGLGGRALGAGVGALRGLRGAALEGAAARAGFAGGMASMLPMEGGETAMELAQDPTAMANTTALQRAGLVAGRGGVNAALESIVPNMLVVPHLLGKAARIQPGLGAGLRNIGLLAAEGTVGEYGTEAAQELTGQFAQNVAHPGFGYDLRKAHEAGLSGAVVGAGLGGVGGLAQGVHSNIGTGVDKARELVGEGVDKAKELTGLGKLKGKLPSINDLVERMQGFADDPGEAGAALGRLTMEGVAKASEAAGVLREYGFKGAQATEKYLGKTYDAVVDHVLKNIDDPATQERFIDAAAGLRTMGTGEWNSFLAALDKESGVSFGEGVGHALGQIGTRVAEGAVDTAKGTWDTLKEVTTGFRRGLSEGPTKAGELPRPTINERSKAWAELESVAPKAMERLLKKIPKVIDQSGNQVPDPQYKQVISDALHHAVNHQGYLRGADFDAKRAAALKEFKTATGVDVFGVADKIRARRATREFSEAVRGGMRKAVNELNIGTRHIGALTGLLKRMVFTESFEKLAPDAKEIFLTAAGNNELKAQRLYANVTRAALDGQKAIEKKYGAGVLKGSLKIQPDMGAARAGAATTSDDVTYSDEGKRVGIAKEVRSPFDQDVIRNVLTTHDYKDRAATNVPIRIKAAKGEVSGKQLAEFLGERHFDKATKQESWQPYPEDTEHNIDPETGELTININPHSLAHIAGDERFREAFAEHTPSLDEMEGLSDREQRGRRFIHTLTTLSDQGIHIDREHLGIKKPGPPIHFEVDVDYAGLKPYTVIKQATKDKNKQEIEPSLLWEEVAGDVKKSTSHRLQLDYMKKLARRQAAEERGEPLPPEEPGLEGGDRLVRERVQKAVESWAYNKKKNAAREDLIKEIRGKIDDKIAKANKNRKRSKDEPLTPAERQKVADDEWAKWSRDRVAKHTRVESPTEDELNDAMDEYYKALPGIIESKKWAAKSNNLATSVRESYATHVQREDEDSINAEEVDTLIDYYSSPEPIELLEKAQAALDKYTFSEEDKKTVEAYIQGDDNVDETDLEYVGNLELSAVDMGILTKYVNKDPDWTQKLAKEVLDGAGLGTKEMRALKALRETDATKTEDDVDEALGRFQMEEADRAALEHLRDHNISNPTFADVQEIGKLHDITVYERTKLPEPEKLAGRMDANKQFIDEAAEGIEETKTGAVREGTVKDPEGRIRDPGVVDLQGAINQDYADFKYSLAQRTQRALDAVRRWSKKKRIALTRKKAKVFYNDAPVLPRTPMKRYQPGEGKDTPESMRTPPETLPPDAKPPVVMTFPKAKAVDAKDVAIHSGGAKGADAVWGRMAAAFGMDTTAHSFADHSVQPGSGTRVEHTEEELKAADAMLEQVNDRPDMDRRIPTDKPYIHNLLRRNYYQVKNSQAVVAISTFTKGKVDGGTAWAAYMGIEMGKPVHVYDQDAEVWKSWDGTAFVVSELPPPYKTFAGVGTREINDEGKAAIREYLRQFKGIPEKAVAAAKAAPATAAAPTKTDADRAAEGDVVAKLPMNYRHGETYHGEVHNMRPEFKGKSTMELIQSDKRTATTRAPDATVKALKPGDLVTFTSPKGLVTVRVTKAAESVRGMDPEVWSKREGWEPGLHALYSKLGYWQFQYERVGAKAAAPAAPAAPAAKVASAAAATKTTEGTVANPIVGDIWAQDGFKVVSTNLGGVHGRGLAKQAADKGLITRKHKDFDSSPPMSTGVLTLAVKGKDPSTAKVPGKPFSEQTTGKNLDLLSSEIDKLIAFARELPHKKFFLPYVGLGFGEGKIEEIRPILERAAAEPNIFMVAADKSARDKYAESFKPGVRSDKTAAPAAPTGNAQLDGTDHFAKVQELRKTTRELGEKLWAADQILRTERDEKRDKGRNPFWSDAGDNLLNAQRDGEDGEDLTTLVNRLPEEKRAGAREFLRIGAELDAANKAEEKYYIAHEKDMANHPEAMDRFINALKLMPTHKEGSLWAISANLMRDMMQHRGDEAWLQREIKGREQRLAKYKKEGEGVAGSRLGHIIKVIEREVELLRANDLQAMVDEAAKRLSGYRDEHPAPNLNAPTATKKEAAKPAGIFEALQGILGEYHKAAQLQVLKLPASPKRKLVNDEVVKAHKEMLAKLEESREAIAEEAKTSTPESMLADFRTAMDALYEELGEALNTIGGASEARVPSKKTAPDIVHELQGLAARLYKGLSDVIEKLPNGELKSHLRTMLDAARENVINNIAAKGKLWAKQLENKEKTATFLSKSGREQVDRAFNEVRTQLNEAQEEAPPDVKLKTPPPPAKGTKGGKKAPKKSVVKKEPGIPPEDSPLVLAARKYVKNGKVTNFIHFRSVLRTLGVKTDQDDVVKTSIAKLSARLEELYGEGKKTEEAAPETDQAAAVVARARAFVDEGLADIAKTLDQMPDASDKEDATDFIRNAREVTYQIIDDTDLTEMLGAMSPDKVFAELKTALALRMAHLKDMAEQQVATRNTLEEIKNSESLKETSKFGEKKFTQAELSNVAQGWANKYLAKGTKVTVHIYDPPANIAHASGFFLETAPNTIFVRRDVDSELDLMAVIAHEFGHLMQFHAFDKAPADVQAKMRAAWAADIKALESGELSQLELAKRFGNAISAAAALHEFGKNWARMTSSESKLAKKKFDKTGMSATESHAYSTRFSEWFANQFSKYVTQGATADMSVEEKTFWEKLAKELRDFYNEVVKLLTPNTTFETWVKDLASPAKAKASEKKETKEKKTAREMSDERYAEIMAAPSEKQVTFLDDPTTERKQSYSRAKLHDLMRAWTKRYMGSEAAVPMLTIYKWKEGDSRGFVPHDRPNTVFIADTAASHLTTLSVLAHEFGHVMEKNTYANASAEVKASIDARWKADVKAWNAGTLSEDEIMQRFGSAARAEYRQITKIEGYTPKQKAYLQKFPEWFANNVSRMITQGIDKDLSPEETSFWKGLIAKLKTFFNKVVKDLRPDAVFEAWAKTLGADAGDGTGGVPPRGPPPNTGSEAPPPPPPGGGKQPGIKHPRLKKKFRDTVYSMVSDKHVRILFDQTLEQGVTSTYETRDQALTRIRKEHASAVGGLKRALELDDEKSAAKMKAKIAESLAEEQKIMADAAILGIIRLATGMEKKAGRAENETFRAAFHIMLSPEEKRILGRAFDQGLAGKKLREIFKNDKNAMEEINSSFMDAAAYAFQVWAADPSQFQLGPQVENIFQKFLNFIRKVFGILTPEEKAELIMTHLKAGRHRDNLPSPVAKVLNKDLPWQQRAQEMGKNIGGLVKQGYDIILSPSFERLMSTGNPAIMKAAEQGYEKTGKEGGEGGGMVQRGRRVFKELTNRLNKVFKDLSEDQLKDLHLAMINDKKPADAEVAARWADLKTWYKDMYAYQVEAGVLLNDAGIKQGYYPLPFNPEKVLKNKAAFIEMLSQPKYAQEMLTTKKTANEIYDGITSYIERGEDLVDVMGESLEPLAEHTRKRSLGFLDRADRVPFMDEDPIHTAYRYAKQAVRQAEYVRVYGMRSTKLKKLKEQAKNVYGATPEQIALLEDYVDGLMGNKEIGMPRELKDVYGAMTVYQNYRLLPFSLFSSLVDPLGIALRTGSLMDAWDAFTYSMGNLFKEWGSGEYSRDFWEQLGEDWGIIEHSGTTIAAHNQYDGITLRGTTKDLNDKLFKYNLLNGWIRNNTIMATKAAQRFIYRASEGKAGKGSERYLEELGLTKDDVVYDEKNQRLLLRADELEASGMSKAKAVETEQKLRNAVEKVVRQSLLNPSAAELPNWASNPYLLPIAHLKQFVFSFNATIVDRIIHEAKHGNYVPATMALGYVPSMIAADFIKDMIAGFGDEPPYKKNWGLADYIGNGVSRSGLTGTGQFFAGASEDIVRGGTGAESMLGPSLQQGRQAIKAFNSGDSASITNWMVRALPLQAVYKQHLDFSPEPVQN